MRQTRWIALSLCAWVALAGGRASAEDPKDPLALLIDFRKEMPKIVKDPAGVQQHADAIAEDTDAELADADAISAQLRTAVMQKFRKVQRNAQLVTVLGGEPMFRLPHFTITMASLGMERSERIAALDHRENEAMVKVIGHPNTRSGEDYSRWANSPAAKPFQDERAQISAWYRQAVDEERRKYKEGDSDAARTLEMLRKETVEEMRVISAFRRAVTQEQRRRRGEPPEPLWTDEEYARLEEQQQKRRDAETEEQHRRMKVRVAPVRTEYEVRPNETAWVIFQVYAGRPAYLLDLLAPKAGQGRLLLDQAAPGELQFPLMYARPGVYQATLTALDADAESASAQVTIRVAGEPLPLPKEEQEPASKLKPSGDGTGATGGPGTAPGGGGPTPVTPLPIQGTFSALIWHANAQLARWDLLSSDIAMKQWPIPLTLTVEPDGRLRGAVRYELPASEMKTPSDPLMRNIFWRVAFDLEGQVSWTTGTTHITVKNGHDECGYEKDMPKTDNQGKPAGILGHWRDVAKVDYSMSLEGWTLPSAQAASWLAALQANTSVVDQLRTFDLENLGIPALLISDANVLAFRDRGFFGMAPLGGGPALDGVVPRRRTYSRAIHHIGYDGKNETETDETAQRQQRADAEAKSATGGWYIKLLGVADPAPATPAEPKDDDLLAFGLWPTRPITVAVGATMSARAMGVLGKNVYDALDLSQQATWTASPGLTLLGGGTFKATEPGTYTLTATVQRPDGPMTSTITVTVTR